MTADIFCSHRSLSNTGCLFTICSIAYKWSNFLFTVSIVIYLLSFPELRVKMTQYVCHSKLVAPLAPHFFFIGWMNECGAESCKFNFGAIGLGWLGIELKLTDLVAYWLIVMYLYQNFVRDRYQAKYRFPIRLLILLFDINLNSYWIFDRNNTQFIWV